MVWCLTQRLRADDVWVGQAGRSPLKYNDVSIRGEQAGELFFRSRAGNVISKPMEQIVRIRVDGEAQLDRAEQAFEKHDLRAAIPAYERASRETRQNWLKSYVTARLVACYDAEGRLADAVKAWIETLRTWPTYGAMIRPGKLQTKGSPLHGQALALIEAAPAAGPLSPEAVRSLKQLHAAILQIEQGRPSTTSRTAGSETAEQPEASGPAGEKELAAAGAGPAGKVDVAVALGKAKNLAERREYDEALDEIQRAIKDLPERRKKAYLPELLVLKAECLLARGDAFAKADKAEQARQEYLYGGLAAMQVVAFFPEGASLVEALYLVGQCHERIGRTEQAVSLYRECRDYAIGRGRPEWGRRAAQSLERLGAKP
jgi:tetratricopeptide (TPR) repeat protein